MLQMISNQDKLERFYADVERLGLKFPVAMIAEATNYKKGTVSSYLNKKIEPSGTFIEAFYKKFQDSLKTIPSNQNGIKHFELDERKQSLERSIENLTQNELRTTAIIERLVTLLEKQYGGTGPTLTPPGTPGTETMNPRKQKVNKD